MTKDTREITNSATIEKLVIKISTTGKKVKSSDAQSVGKYPVIDQGEKPISGYVDDASKLLGVQGQIIVFGDHSRRIKLVNHDFVPGADGIVVLKPIEDISAELLVYLMEYQILTMRDNGYARHWQHLKKIMVQYPKCKLAQAQIVSSISVSSLQIDHGLSSLEKAERQLELYRQSVLKDAFEGKLTADWRAANPDLVEPPDKLLARIEFERKAAHQAELDAWENAVNQWEANGKEGKKPTKPKFFQFDEEVIKSSSTMLSVKLGLTISEPKYGTSKKCSYESGQVPVLRIPNLGRGKIDSQDLKYADFSRHELDNYKLESGDLLIIRSNGSVSLVGKTCVISEQEEGFLFAGYLIRIKPIQSIICSEYLRHILGSLALRKQIVEKAKSTSGVNNLNAKEIQNLTINLVSLKEQQRLVEMLSENEERYHDQLSILNELKRKTDALKQSILKQAFSGHELLEDAS